MQRNQNRVYLKKYEHLLKGTNKSFINIVGKQRELLKIITHTEEFFETVSLSWSNSCFEIVYITFYVNFQYWNKLLLPPATLTVNLS